MIVLDYIILALVVLSTVIGIIKGLIKQVLTIVGVIVVPTATAAVAPHVQGWLAKAIENDSTRQVVAMLATLVVIVLVYVLIALLITKLLKNITIVKVLDRILGGVIGFGVIYFVFAVVFALFNSTSESFMPLLKGWLGEPMQNSWIATHVYANNFFGNWVIKGIAEKLLQSMPAA